MIKKIILVLVAMIALNMNTAIVGASNTEEEISEEIMEKAISAYKDGVAFTKSKAYDNAIKAFNNAVSYYPSMTDAYYNIAAIYVMREQYDEAYNIYNKIISINPHDYDSMLQAAKICYNKKNYSTALKYLKHIPDDYENYGLVKQMERDATELFDNQKNQIERSKITKADKVRTKIIDKFNAPAGMVVDSEGNMYVAAYADNSIIKVDKNKNKSVLIKDYLLDGPIGLAIDKFDNIYVANYEANNILKITKGGQVNVFMSNVSQPYFLYIKDEVLYISEQGNDVVLTYNLKN